MKSADNGQTMYTAVTATGLNPLSGKVTRKSGDNIEVLPSVLEGITIMLPQNGKPVSIEPAQQQFTPEPFLIYYNKQNIGQ